MNPLISLCLRATFGPMGTAHCHTATSGDESVEPWNSWYHVTIHVYGSWLRGDPRGWRSRHHREHADGDYESTSEEKV